MTTIKLNYYTYYLLNGKRKVFLGVNEHDAYVNNQSYVDGQQAIAMIDEGITDSFNWKDNSWVAKEDFTIPVITVEGLGEATINQIKPEALELHKHICYDYPSKNQLSIALRWNHYHFGWVKVIEILHGEYQSGTYSRDDKDGHHYLVNRSLYFRPNQAVEASEAFIKLMHDPSADVASESLADIKDYQSCEIIYTSLTEMQELWLLGSLIKRLDNLAFDHGLVRDRFIYIDRDRHYGQDNILIEEMYSQIQCYCDKLLITNNGNRRYDYEKYLSEKFGYKFTVGERDGFGCLSVCIHVNNGILVYG